ncbi:MAG: hypothetical protein LBT75_01445 [Bacilli bacterium]|jgi:hypothetical protein|nr:hypothetical protein [Bacilli bacterium]
MKVLVIVSNKVHISEIKKIKLIIDDLINLKAMIYYSDYSYHNLMIKEGLDKKAYSHQSLFFIKNKPINAIKTQLLHHKMNKVIIIGLVHHDPLTKLIDVFIELGIDCFIVIPPYGIFSDASLLVNQGAWLFNHVTDLFH